MIFTREAFKELRFAYGMALAGIAVAGFLVAGSYWYWQVRRKMTFNHNDRYRICARAWTR